MDEYREWSLNLYEFSGGPFDGSGSSTTSTVPDEVAPIEYPEGSYIRDPLRKGTNGIAVLVWVERPAH